MNGRIGFRFVPSLEPLGERVNPSGLVAEQPAVEGGAVPVYWHVIGNGGARGDDVVVDGPIITAEDYAGRFFNGVVSRFSSGGANETITIAGARTEKPDTPTSDYTAIAFGGGWGGG